MYFARFAYKETYLLTAALKWPKRDGPLLNEGWTQPLLEQTQCDLALRIEVGRSDGSVLLLLNTDATAEAALGDLCGRLLKNDAPSGVVVPSTAQDFDTLTAGMPTRQMRVNYHGYHHDGKPLACDFRLHPMLAGHCSAAPTVYQVHFRPHLPDKEIERRVRKYMAWLDVERPFTEAVRAMQRILSARLRQRGFLTCEYLATEDRDDLEQWMDRIRTHFDQTIGRLGFREAPIDTGDFTDVLTIGCHPARCEESDPEIPALAATVFGEEEARSFLSSDIALRQETRPLRGATRIQAQVFISYAASDYTHAAATCRNLEENGVVCWIAPRDINRDILSYPEAIQRGISEAKVVVVFLSDAANLSVHIPRELDLALERKLPIIPVRLHDVAPVGQLKYLLRTCQWLDFYSRDSHAAIMELIGRLRSLVGD